MRGAPMATTNRERVGKALELLQAGLGPFVEREFKRTYPARGVAEAHGFLREDRLNAKLAMAEWDVAVLLRVMWDAWHEVFGKALGRAERSLVSELRDVRNRWAHQHPFSNDDADRALDSAARLLTAISAPQADEVGQMKMELRRLMFAEQRRSETPKTAGGGASMLSDGPDTPKPESQPVIPKATVASGRGRQTECAPRQAPAGGTESVPKPGGTTEPFVGPEDKYALVVSYIKQHHVGWTRPTPLQSHGREPPGDRRDDWEICITLRSVFPGQAAKALRAISCSPWQSAHGPGVVGTLEAGSPEPRADFWVFVLPSLSERTISFIIFPPRELLQRLQPIRRHLEDWIQLYLWPTKDGRCWETRHLSREFDRAIDTGTYEDPARDFSTFLNAWQLVAARLS